MRLSTTLRLSVLALGLGLAACAETPAPVAATPTPAPMAAPAAPNTSDLVGARASSGEAQMTARGFTRARTRGLTAYWAHAASNSCVRTVTANGRYRTVASVAPSNCAAPAPAPARRR